MGLEESIKSALKELKSELGIKNLGYTTGNLIVGHPVYALWEKLGLGISDRQSIDARLNATVLSYLGVGYIFGKVRDWTYELARKINPEYRSNFLHETMYTGIFCYCFSSAVYSMNASTVNYTVAGGITGG